MLGGGVGHSTFGFDRYVNQQFYTSREWRRVREIVTLRDDGCDLGVPGYEIHTGLLIHHINPMTPDDIIHGEDWILNPDFLVTTTHATHNAIHYGNSGTIVRPVLERTPNDTMLWQRRVDHGR